MADGNVTPTTAANFIPELWRDAILDYAERKFDLKNRVLDFSSMLSGGGDILHIPKVTEETAAAKSAGTAVTYTNNTDGKIDLTVNQHHYEAKRIDDIVKVQESADLFNAQWATTQATMFFMNEELSWNPKPKGMGIRTEGQSKIVQGQSIEVEKI